MTITVLQLAKRLEIAPEAVYLHALDLNIDILEDDIISEEDAKRIEELELSNEVAAVEHEIEDMQEREVIEKQAEKTVGSQKKVEQKKREKTHKTPTKAIIEEVKVVEEDGKIVLPENINVKDFSAKIGKPMPLVLIKLKQNGIIANIKTDIDYDTAAIVAMEFGVEVRKEGAKLSGEALFRGNLDDLLSQEDSANLTTRPPVVCIMGHVDHGKTSLLDYIRKANVASGEAGGITQRIGAYQIAVDYNGDSRLITFLDTPGHEAFQTMRARGARVTDFAVLVVAATEGVKPQTIEAIRHAKEANTPLVVALTKTDLPGLDDDTLKRQLSEYDVLAEDWGGGTPFIRISAKSGEGIKQLLDTLLLMADLRELKANPHRTAIGTVLESSQDAKKGVFATVLINTGTLKMGDDFVIHDQYGRIRTMKDENNKDIKTALPSRPVQITGLTKLPNTGDIIEVMRSTKEARQKAEQIALIKHDDLLEKSKKFSLSQLRNRIGQEGLDKLNIVLKADSQGTLEAMKQQMEKLKNDTMMVKVVHSGVGDVSDSDVMLAATTDAIIVAFSVEASSRVLKNADDRRVKVIISNIIYELTEAVEKLISGESNTGPREVILGVFVVKAVFASNKKMAVLGGDVVSGKIIQKARFRVLEKRDTINSDREDGLWIRYTGNIDSMQMGQKTITEANTGLECGIKVNHTDAVFTIGMRLEVFKME